MITLNLARGDNYESVPLRLPTTPGEVDEVFAALDAASRYAGEVQIIGVDSGVPSLAKHLKGAGLTDPDAFDKLNRLAEKIDGMDERQRDIFSGALDAESAGSLDDVLRVSDSLEAYTFVPNVRSDEELGRYVVVAGQLHGDRRFPEEAWPYLDFAKIGAEYFAGHGGAYTVSGYVMRREDGQQQVQESMKLYMPLTADFYERDEWGDMSEDSEEWDGRTLLDHEGGVLTALVKNRVPEESKRGLMHWYGEDDAVNEKVQSAVFTAEERNGRLWGVVECRVAGPLSPEELDTLKEYVTGQASDAWGEGFEQRPIEVDGGELYVHLWQSDDWSIQTEQERFAPKVAEGLPELCFSILKTTGQLICIKRGESGYYLSDWDTGDKERNVELADEMNENLGVSPVQRQAMEIGSLAGWDVPGADPKAYEQDALQMGGM